jgi:hypothetical protein
MAAVPRVVELDAGSFWEIRDGTKREPSMTEKSSGIHFFKTTIIGGLLKPCADDEP